MTLYWYLGGGLLLASTGVVGVSLWMVQRAFVGGGPALLCPACTAPVLATASHCSRCGGAMPTSAELLARWKMAKAEMRKRSRLAAAFMALGDKSVEARLANLSKARQNSPLERTVVVDGQVVRPQAALPPGTE